MPEPSDAPFFEASWSRAWQALGLPPPEPVRQDLLRAYCEPQRHYHTPQHLRETLALLEPVLPQCRSPGAVELALWFHDAIYDPKGKDNEALSADWALRVLKEQGACEAVCVEVERLILATQHSAEPVDADARLLVDVDLSILAAEPARFAEYEKQVRAEYAWVPKPLFVIKRREVLRSFADRPHIYGTEHFRALLEARARQNLQKALSWF
ncbi:HD domain-containing protein [Diaphorobacter caeni]|uniref:HD domain-containing protein n=1 Tax=Diaphorobacter caeni TaxID=2784387 RepID=UPI00188E7B2C|nr:N-methyl-D-aspartate receptor NMDAR2C subunit [Diaphorobacter caeni]MBF5006662.1 N-methyl-D-aspartate receptor NMDAR2C subunit [Diaphorobacter caeni]